jgi:hypothetical protein
VNTGTPRASREAKENTFMNPGRITAWSAGAVLALGLAACGGSTSGGSAAPASGGAAPQSAAAAATTPAAAGSSSAALGTSGLTSGLTPPGTQLALGQSATVGWVPEGGGEGAHAGLKLQVDVVSIVKAPMSDFKNVDLTGAQKSDTPYYVTVKIKALGTAAPKSSDDPAITFDAIDDRGQEQESVTFFGTFQPCNDNTPPQPFAGGKSYTSCLVYLMPGGGSIQKVQWADGPSGSDGVTAYFDKPIVWG